MAFDPGQISVLVRQGGQYAAGAVSVLVVLGNVDAETAKGAVAAIGQVVDGLNQATAGLAKLAVILGPGAGGALAWYAKIRSSVKNKIADTAAIASDPAQPKAHDARAALRAATASLPGTVVVTGQEGASTAQLAGKIAAMPEAARVSTTPGIAAANPSAKVVTDEVRP